MNDDIKTPEVLRNIAALRATDTSWIGIADKISKMVNREVSPANVRSAYEIFASRSADIIAGDEELKGLLKTTVIDQADQLKQINGYVMNLMKKLANKTDVKEMQAMINAAREIREQIQLQANLLNKMGEGWDTNRINRIEYTKISVNNLTELEKSGYIKILRRPGSKDKINFREEEISITEKQLQELIEKHKLISGNYLIQVAIDAEYSTKEKEVKQNEE